MNFDYIVLGGGMTGCLAVLNIKRHRPDATVALIEPKESLASDFGANGYTFLRHTRALGELFDAHSIIWSKGDLQRGAVMTGLRAGNKLRVRLYPGDFSPADISAFQLAHYVKTRGTEEGMSDEVGNFGGSPVHRMLYDHDSMVAAVEYLATWYRTKAGRIDEGAINIGPRQWIQADSAIINTVPLPVFARQHVIDLGQAPECRFRWLHTWAFALDPKVANALGNIHYVYTHDAHRVHRIHLPGEGIAVAEWNVGDNATSDGSDLDLAVAQRDLLRLTSTRPAGREVTTSPGHIFPVIYRGWEPAEHEWCLGRFGAWEPRTTVDRTVDQLNARLA